LEGLRTRDHHGLLEDMSACARSRHSGHADACSAQGRASAMRPWFASETAAL
jgi:hypothetical protein